MVIWKHSLTQSICALYLTKDPKLKVFVWFQYLKTVLHISVLNFFTFLCSPQPAQVRRAVFSHACPLLSPLTQCVLSSYLHTHRMLEQDFVVFSFTFPSLHFCLHIPKTNRLQTDNSISAGEFLFFLCFMGYGGRGLLFFLCPERTPKSPNFGWNPSPSKTPNLQIQKPTHKTETPNLNHRKPQNQNPKHKAKHQTL